MKKLLTRDEFREGVFERDHHKCVMCGVEGKLDAHHIIERRLFQGEDEKGGYFIDNGASLCEEHHIKAEETTLSCEEIRSAAGIKKIILPSHMYDDNDFTYTKWGDIELPSGQRLKGELFFDESVQKILAQGNVLHLYSNYVKYQRTFHLPWSEKINKDDRKLESVDHFIGKEVIVTAKLDGENTSMYSDYIHARSINSGSHDSRDWVKGLWARISYEIPMGWRICGENMYAVHTIKYDCLETYFYVISIWNERNECLSWDETLEWCYLLGLTSVPVLYRGLYDEAKVKALRDSEYNGTKNEGYVIRLADSFKYGEFRKSVAKFVHESFVIKHGHWSQQKIETNELSAKVF